MCMYDSSLVGAKIILMRVDEVVVAVPFLWTLSPHHLTFLVSSMCATNET